MVNLATNTKNTKLGCQGISKNESLCFFRMSSKGFYLVKNKFGLMI